MSRLEKAQGYLTIACGIEYVKYATLLAKTIKVFDKLRPVAVISDLPERFFDNELFDEVIPSNGSDAFVIKLQMFNYTPFLETLFVDADSVLIDKIDIIWSQIKRSNQDFFTYGCIKNSGKEFNTDIKILKKIFNTEYINIFNGGLYYFKKSKVAETIFEIAKNSNDLFVNSGIKNTNKLHTKIFTDELLFSYAMSKFKLNAHPVKILNSLWTFAYLNCQSSSVEFNLANRYCIISYSHNNVIYDIASPLIFHYNRNDRIDRSEIYRKLSQEAF